jgi:hypothetical protein
MLNAQYHHTQQWQPSPLTPFAYTAQTDRLAAARAPLLILNHERVLERNSGLQASFCRPQCSLVLADKQLAFHCTHLSQRRRFSCHGPEQVDMSNEGQTHKSDSRISQDIPHAIHVATNDEGRIRAVAFASATVGLQQALQLSAADKSQLKSYHISDALGAYKMPDVTISVEAAEFFPDGQDGLRVHGVRRWLQCKLQPLRLQRFLPPECVFLFCVFLSCQPAQSGRERQDSLHAPLPRYIMALW